MNEYLACRRLCERIEGLEPSIRNLTKQQKSIDEPKTIILTNFKKFLTEVKEFIEKDIQKPSKLTKMSQFVNRDGYIQSIIDFNNEIDKYRSDLLKDLENTSKRVRRLPSISSQSELRAETMSAKLEIPSSSISSNRSLDSLSRREVMTIFRNILLLPASLVDTMMRLNVDGITLKSIRSKESCMELGLDVSHLLNPTQLDIFLNYLTKFQQEGIDQEYFMAASYLSKLTNSIQNVWSESEVRYV